MGIKTPGGQNLFQQGGGDWVKFRCYEVLTTPGLRKIQHEMGEWLPSSSLGASGRPLVAPSPGSTGQRPERHQGRPHTTSFSSSMHSQANPELFFFSFFAARSHTRQMGTLEQESEAPALLLASPLTCHGSLGSFCLVSFWPGASNLCHLSAFCW